MKDKINIAISRYLDIIASDPEILKMRAMSFDPNDNSSCKYRYLQEINGKIINDDLLPHIFVDIKDYLARYLAKNCKIEKQYDSDGLKAGILYFNFRNGTVKVDLKRLYELGVITDSVENVMKASTNSEDYLVIDPDILKGFHEYYHNNSLYYKFIDKFYDNIYSVYSVTSSMLSFGDVYHEYKYLLDVIKYDFDIADIFYLMNEILTKLYVQDTRAIKLKVKLYQDEEDDCNYRFDISCD